MHTLANLSRARAARRGHNKRKAPLCLAVVLFAVLALLSYRVFHHGGFYPWSSHLLSIHLALAEDGGGDGGGGDSGGDGGGDGGDGGNGGDGDGGGGDADGGDGGDGSGEGEGDTDAGPDTAGPDTAAGPSSDLEGGAPCPGDPASVSGPAAGYGCEGDCGSPTEGGQPSASNPDTPGGSDGGGPFIPIPAPTASLSANPDTIVEGHSSTLSWSSSDTTGCSLDPGFGNVETNGARTTSPANTTTYTLSCSGPGGSVQAQTTVTVIPRPRVTLYAIPPGPIEVPDSINLSWSSTNANSCVASGDWGGGKGVSGSEAVTKPRGTYTFTITCSGPGGTSDPSSVAVRVIQVPRCSFSSDPTSIILPQTSTLSWSCSYADSCSIDQGIGSVNNVSGSVEVRPPATTSYTLSCSGLDGSRSWPATVGVGFIPKLKEILPR